MESKYEWAKESILTKSQKREVVLTGDSVKKHGYRKVVINIRYDDSCGNGHNTLSITGTCWEKGERSRDGSYSGCIHGVIEEVAPEYKPLIKFHLCSSETPMHYVANTVYWAKQGNLENARNSAIWEDGTLEELSSEEALMERLPRLMEEFRNVVTEFGFQY